MKYVQLSSIKANKPSDLILDCLVYLFYSTFMRQKNEDNDRFILVTFVFQEFIVIESNQIVNLGEKS